MQFNYHFDESNKQQIDQKYRVNFNINNSM